MIKDQLSIISQTPDQAAFGTLTDIMERFYQVPYDQFQNELNDWVRRGFSEANKALNPSEELGMECFAEKVIELGNAIFEMNSTESRL